MSHNLVALRSLFSDGIIEETIREANGRRYVRLKELAPDAKLKHVDLYDLPVESMLLKLDLSSPPNSLFKGTKGECKRCDYLLITHFNDRKILLFIEMKSRSFKEGDVVKHFKASECITDYAASVLKRFFSLSSFFDDYEKRFVVFYKRPVAKSHLRPSNGGNRNKTPETMLKYPSPHAPTLSALL